MVRVTVEQGCLEGATVEAVTGGFQFHSFKGIPYAAPPVGKLRFKAPEPPLAWSGVRSALEHGPECAHIDIFTNETVAGGEDCLYLNVYTPDTAARLPVMLFIHGGGYQSGSGDDEWFGADHLVQHGVVLVTINYRLGALGFLCIDNRHVPGNAGLKDQVAALRWVQKNIAAFGGDPANVTIFGESAGGASVSLHTVSPMSAGLFHRAISMSGVATCDFSAAFEPRRRAFVLGKVLGCHTDDDDALLEFLQSVPVGELIKHKAPLRADEVLFGDIADMFSFVPVVEKDFGQERFVREDFEVSLSAGRVHDVDQMLGYTDQEAGIVHQHLRDEAHVYDLYPEKLMPFVLRCRVAPPKLLRLADLVRERYFGSGKIDESRLIELTTFLSDKVFVHWILDWVRKLPKGTGRRYVYKFAQYSERNLFIKGAHEATGARGAAHMDDLLYLFHDKRASLPADKSDVVHKLIAQACTLFTNFARCGDPTPDATLGLVWPQYDDARRSLNIGNSLEVETAADEQVYQFWRKVFRAADDPNF